MQCFSGRVQDLNLRGHMFDAHSGSMQASLSRLLIYYVIRPTQPSPLSGTENDYQPMSGDALRLGVKAGVNRVWW